MSRPHHLAQANVARFRAPLGDPGMEGFVARIAEMNALAERSRGFVWRYRSPEGGSGDLFVFRDYFVPFDADRLFFNMSVWETVEDLRDYVFGSAHAELLRGRAEWIDGFDKASLAMWWIPAGRVPTVAEAVERLESLDLRGPTADAFTFTSVFVGPEPG